MKKSIFTAFFFFSFIGCVLAQNAKELALEKGHKAIKAMDEGDIDESLVLLAEANELDPENFDYPYEMAYGYYLKKDFKKSTAILEKLAKHKDKSERYYQLLGNNYDYLAKPDKAVKTYKKGLELYPNSGILYFELGVIALDKKDYNLALSYWEKGIKIDPKFPSNYFWAAQLYFNSDEEVWGVLYGEIFMNLERNSERTEAMSKMLYDTYVKSIKITSDTSYSVSFSKFSTIDASQLKDSENFKLPFGIGLYEPLMLVAISSVKSIDGNTLPLIRSDFLNAYFSNENNVRYPNVLFDYQKKISDAGHLEAYNRWLLMQGDYETFSDWKTANELNWKLFVKWFESNALSLEKGKQFYRYQY